jgi:hypothetical protein
MKHTVVQGECLISIAQKFGIANWRTIYDAPENEAFKKLRKTPNMICPGDVVYIPTLTGTKQPANLNKKTTYVLKKAKGYLSICLVDSKNNPLPDIPYDVSFYKSERDKKGEPLLEIKDKKSDADGYVEHQLPKGAKFAVLTYSPYPTRPSLKQNMGLKVGELDDPSTQLGMRSRLNHFGFYSGDGRMKEPETDMFNTQLAGFKDKYGLSDDDSVVAYFDNPTAIA